MVAVTSGAAKHDRRSRRSIRGRMKGKRIGGEMRSKVGAAKSAQDARQAQSGCSPALEEHPREQVDQFFSQGSTTADRQWSLRRQDRVGSSAARNPLRMA